MYKSVLLINSGNTEVLCESDTFNKTEGFPWTPKDNLKFDLLFSKDPWSKLPSKDRLKDSGFSDLEIKG